MSRTRSLPLAIAVLAASLLAGCLHRQAPITPGPNCPRECENRYTACVAECDPTADDGCFQTCVSERGECTRICG